jgi:hypothetical protein
MPLQADTADPASPVCWCRPLEGEGGFAATGVLVRQLTSRTTKPFIRHLVEIAVLLGFSDDFIDFQAQLVFTFAHTDEVRAVFEQ